MWIHQARELPGELPKKLPEGFPGGFLGKLSRYRGELDLPSFMTTVRGLGLFMAVESKKKGSLRSAQVSLLE